jgi:hypothetical protein
VGLVVFWPGPILASFYLSLLANLRFAELENTWENTTKALFYGGTHFADALKQAEDACQAILDKPRPGCAQKGHAPPCC